MNFHINQALVLAPHPDDAELGCGATVARLLDEGASVTILMLSDRGEPTWFTEAIEAAKILAAGSDKIGVHTEHHTVFHFGNERQSILRQFEHWRDTLRPDIVFAPAIGDLHQDHRTVTEEAQRVFKGMTVLTYEIVRSSYDFRPVVFVPVTQDHIERKARSVNCYSTQREKLYTQWAAIAGLARVRGCMCDTPLAEAFGAAWIIGD